MPNLMRTQVHEVGVTLDIENAGSKSHLCCPCPECRIKRYGDQSVIAAPWVSLNLIDSVVRNNHIRVRKGLRFR